ncbi:prephenate dehydratase [Candidatus Methylacidithermus pantelleriae]|uniref:prephenate dehydratase n=1 Tax=Candidatus Methylacidithermus pantelleriae TaxID=2744239 RepID=A0A8J2BRI4_9BACT|nr:prephenate dehydratase domain-containing protein [Candidatus Methylacidithermus pantelleriae]CAF0693982.1 Chorismate mutase I [Candidatus Methylacidithermus pantelleriae]
MSVAFLGPAQTFSHLVAKKRFPKRKLLPLPSIPEVVEYVRRHPLSSGIVPIENSSSGMIPETVDLLLDRSFSLCIREELALRVRLALLGRRGAKIKTLYSHAAPLYHCRNWIMQRFPEVQLRRVASTAEAARLASLEPASAALSTRDAAILYGLEVLEYPVADDTANLTQFFVLGHRPAGSGARETSLAVLLKEKVGSLCSFLEPFREEGLNLKRIVSHPVMGHPNTYFFFLSVQAPNTDPRFIQATEKAKKHTWEMRLLGSYPVRRPYSS